MSISRSDSTPGRTVVIGLGNPLMGDDGLGLTALARLRAEWNLPSDVELIDGGTCGMNLLPIIEDAERVLLIDAIEAGAAPGTEIVIARERLPRYLSTKLSSHQVDLRDVLALAELRGTLPQETAAVGLQPACVEMSDKLSDPLCGRINDLVTRVVGVLESWGHACVRKHASVEAR